VKQVVLDEVDHRILTILVQDGRASYSKIGEDVGLSPHGAANRVRRLVDAGVITGFRAEVNLGAVGRAIDAIVDVRLLPGTTSKEFEQRVAGLNAIQELVFVTGRFDYHVRAACRDTDHLNETVRALRGGVVPAQTETRIVMGATSYARPIE
jgi:Lrp/AsnC family leucine-responsive transcriptional regulator